ncbi:MAG: hypothetical protein AAFS12_12925, partial [Cyanobacteria bacterium J06632_19]
LCAINSLGLYRRSTAPLLPTLATKHPLWVRSCASAPTVGAEAQLRTHRVCFLPNVGRRGAVLRLYNPSEFMAQSTSTPPR